MSKENELVGGATRLLCRLGSEDMGSGGYESMLAWDLMRRDRDGYLEAHGGGGGDEGDHGKNDGQQQGRDRDAIPCRIVPPARIAWDRNP